MKRAELQKKQLIAESQSALELQQKELALARHKLDEQARLQALRLEEEAAVAVAKANTIDDELGYGDDDKLSHLPEDNPSHRVQYFIENQCIDPPFNIEVTQLNTNDLPNPSTGHMNSQPQHASPVQHAPTPHPLNPTVNKFTPGSHPDSPSKSDQNVMKSCIEFMAHRELMRESNRNLDIPPPRAYLGNLLVCLFKMAGI